jgi:hypothetical protein
LDRVALSDRDALIDSLLIGATNFGSIQALLQRRFRIGSLRFKLCVDRGGLGQDSIGQALNRVVSFGLSELAVLLALVVKMIGNHPEAEASRSDQSDIGVD